jgi:hypothetical protein
VLARLNAVVAAGFNCDMSQHEAVPNAMNIYFMDARRTALCTISAARRFFG